MDSTTAKKFLISKVVEEAGRENVSLSELEKKMLHFSEAHPSLRDIYEVSAEFERNHDSGEYEAKVAGLLRNARDRDEKDSTGRDQWKDALDALKGEDHYILVMVKEAFGPSRSGSRLRDFLVYIAIGVGFVVILFLASMWRPGH